MNTPSPTKNCHSIQQTFCNVTPNFYSVSLLQTKYSHHTLTFFPSHPPKMFCYPSKKFATPQKCFAIITQKMLTSHPKIFFTQPKNVFGKPNSKPLKNLLPQLPKISAILSLKLFCNSTPPRNILVCHLTHKFL